MSLSKNGIHPKLDDSKMNGNKRPLKRDSSSIWDQITFPIKMKQTPFMEKEPPNLPQQKYRR